MKVRNTFYYDTAAAGGGGNTLAGLGLDPDNPVTDTGGLQSGDGTPKLPDLSAAGAGAAATVEGVNSDGTIQDGYVKNADGTVAKVPETVEGLNADGTVQDGYTKNTDGTITKNPPADDDDDPEEGNFFETVEKITGTKVEVEYPEGIDPVSPEGVAIREQKLLEIGAVRFEEYLQTTDPRAYAFFMHRAAGKPEEEFFGTKGGYTLPPKDSLATDADAQSAVYKYELTVLKGVSPDEADALIAIAIKNNTLGPKATASYGTIEAAQQKQLSDLQQQSKILEDQEKAANDAIIRSVDTTIDKAISFMVPEASKPEFKRFVVDNLRYQDGKHYIVQEVSADSIKTQVEALLFQWKKGDLKDIVRKQAETKASQRLTLKHKAASTTGKTGEGLGKSSKGSVALESII